MALLELLMDPMCPCRIENIEVIKAVVKNFPDLEIKEINVFDNPEKLEDMGFVGIKIFPVLVLDGKIIKAGIPKADELTDILHRNLKGEHCG